jgi:hypothetical protein
MIRRHTASLSRDIVNVPSDIVNVLQFDLAAFAQWAFFKFYKFVKLLQI